jgi:hypothetical protein
VWELDPSQISIVESMSVKPKTPAELLADENKRQHSFTTFLAEREKSFSEQNKQGGDNKVTVIGPE